MSAITWLHLSDLHFRKGEQQTWNRDIVLRTLLDDVCEQIASEGLRPDFVAVSGDVAFSGAPEEYALAGQFLDELLKVTGLPKTRLFVVPGNHDVDRSAITRGAAAIASSLDNRQLLDELLTTDADRRLIFRKFSHYADFVNGYFGEQLPFDDECYFHVKFPGMTNMHVAVLGLNSAWLSAGDEDRGRLALGERQVRQALEASRDADMRIVLLHHPFEWLREFDRDDCEALLMDGCDFILHGHLHRTGLLSLKTPDAGAMLIAAGACYETREYPNGYNWARLDLTTGQGTIYLRTYSDRRGGFWTKDAQTYKNVPNGEFAFVLPQSQQKTKAPRVKVHAPLVDSTKLEASYLRRIQTTCNALPLAVIDPRAVERTRQQTMDLVRVYVALNTQTPVPVEEEERKAKSGRKPRAERPEGTRETRLLSALEAATRERQMVLLGDPGSGKSTFANYLALCLASARLENLGETSAVPGDKWLAHLGPTWTHGALLPLQIILRHFAKSNSCDGTAAGLWDFIVQTLEAQQLDDFAPFLHQKLHDGGVLVLLDGLDEVADPAKWKAVRDAVAAFAATHVTNRFLVTCRGYAYQDARWQLDRFPVFTLAPFTPEQSDAFIGCWYNEVCRLGWKTEGEAQELTRRLQEATRRGDLAPLAKNPLQLAMMASLHFSWGRLPDDRVELYQEMVRLLLVRWQEARLGEETGVTQLVRAGELESALERVAFVAHRAQQGTVGTADISEVTLRSVFKDCLEGSWDRAGEMVTFIQDRAGLLIDRGKGMYTFPHRSYQEYLAGSYLAVQPDFPDEAARLVRENYAQWREVTLWAVAVMARLKKMTHVAVDVAAALCPREAPGAEESEDEWRAAHLAGEALLEIGLESVQARERHAQVLTRAQKWLSALVERGVLTPADRAAAGRTLARLGDPRPGVGLRQDGLPDIVWCEVPAGEFIMGTRKEDIPALMKKYGGDRQWYESETPQLRSNLPPFLIAQYPVTNAQFDAFVKADGYRDARYWREAAAQGWWQEDGKFKGRLDDEPRNRQADFGAPFNLPNHPVVGVSWYEALAFCRWLTERMTNSEWRTVDARDVNLLSAIRQQRFVARLPTEAEWERAARGLSTGAQDDGRVFPWGSDFDSARCNMAETGIHATSTVGMFLLGASPCGALDMSGNVWEWCSTKWIDNYKDYAKRAKDRENLEGDDPRVLRGGAFYGSRLLVRCAYRVGYAPVVRSGYLGFRVVVSPL